MPSTNLGRVQPDSSITTGSVVPVGSIEQQPPSGLRGQYTSRNEDFETRFEDDKSQEDNPDHPMMTAPELEDGLASSFFNEKPNQRFSKYGDQFENLLDIQELKQSAAISQARISADSSRLLVVRKKKETQWHVT